jgi:hypothetical protein
MQYTEVNVVGESAGVQLDQPDFVSRALQLRIAVWNRRRLHSDVDIGFFWSFNISENGKALFSF